MRTDHPQYLEHRCDILETIRKSEWYHGELIYKMYGEGTQWYFQIVTDWGGAPNTPISFCPYCGYKLPEHVSTENV